MKIKYEYYDEAKTKIKARYATPDDSDRWVGPFEEYFENGNLKRRGQYRNVEGLTFSELMANPTKNLTGPYEEYYESGILEHRCNYVDGVLNGRDEEYTRKGELFKLTTYKMGVKEGPFEKHEYGSISDHRFGWFKIRGSYHNDKLNGLCEHFYEIDNGMTETEYYIQGGYHKMLMRILPENFKFEYKCEMTDDKKNGRYEGFHQVTEGWNGAWESSRSSKFFGMTYPWTICQYENDMREGPYVSFHLNGQKAEECTFVHDKLEGKYLCSYPDGVFHIKAEYRDGKRIGLCEVNENGSITRVKYNENGKMEGQMSYFKFGATEAYGYENYKNGILDGEYRFYNPETGRLQSCGHYVNGKKEGICEYYDDNGNLKYKGIYEHGVMVKDCMQEEENKRIAWKNKQFEKAVHSFAAQMQQLTR